ncbi:MFS transporter [Actinomadura sp. WAC 06369]|uniref:MFS transporter n=1 Tax=Actinomadura sp. WAC 06369 TaxID=2203193 RepID=UPI000F77F62A|nr:MFS transporter [Actinomadura sp. WAC 06369]RSN66242.1 MFS transporter [Actinomadura sp. WAC 06369]
MDKSGTPPRRWLPVALIMFGVGWGANQFASLLVLYTERLHLGGGAAQAVFGVYALGLVPGLALGGPLSDRFGRRRVALPSACASAPATLVLMAGAAVPELLYAGRLLAGVVTGAVLAAGTAWVKELAPGPGVRATALAVSAGFGAGPLAAALVAQWAPSPLVTAYVPHLLIMAVAVPAALRVPDVRPARPSPDGLARGRRLGGFGGLGGVRRPAFRGAVVPVAIWTFAAPTSAFALLPAVVPVERAPIVHAGLVTALTLGSGMAAQPLARRLEARHPRLVARAGLLAVSAGLLAAALTVALRAPALTAAAAVPLGLGYGLVLTYSLGETARIAAPHELAGLTAAAYAVVYAGMFTPLLLTVLARAVPMALLLAVLSGLAALCLLRATRHAVLRS